MVLGPPDLQFPFPISSWGLSTPPTYPTLTPAAPHHTLTLVSETTSCSRPQGSV